MNRKHGVEELNFAHASDDDLRGIYEVLESWWDTDLPGQEKPGFDEWRIGNKPMFGWDGPYYHVVRDDGRIVGIVEGWLATEEASAHIAAGKVIVRPEHQGQGIATALLKTALAAIPDRTTVFEGASGPAGAKWATRHGFRVTNSMTRQLQVLTEPLPEIGEVPAGYELVRWNGRAPEEFVGAFVEACNGMKDAPFGDKELEAVHHTPERIREEENDLLARDVEVWVVLALHGDEAAGVTMMHRYPNRPDVGDQRETVVLQGHRGKGLGRLMKAAMLRELTGIDRVETQTSTSNEHMLRVNRSLGYTDTSTWLDVSGRVADLAT